MLRLRRGAACALMFSFALFGSIPAIADDADDFGALPVIGTAQLSASGRYAAVIIPVDGRYAAAIYDLQAGGSPRLFAPNNLIVRDVMWAGDERVLVTASQSTTEVQEITTWARAFSVTPDLKEYRLLADGPGFSGTTRILPMGARNPADSRHVFMQSYSLAQNTDGLQSKTGDTLRSLLRLRLYQFDVVTGSSDSLGSGTASTVQWYVAPNGKMIARLDTVKHGDSTEDQIWSYASGSAKQIAAFPSTKTYSYRSSPDGTKLYYESQAEDGTRLYTIDLASGTKEEVPVAGKTQPITAVIADEWSGAVIGVTYPDSKRSAFYFDPKLEDVQTGLDGLFPDDTVFIVSANQDKSTFLFSHRSATDPGSLFLYKPKSFTLTKLGDDYPQLAQRKLSTRTYYKYKARDGLDIDAVLSLPAGSTGKKLPTVILPHGGPRAHDDLDFDWWSEFLTARGYAVLQPNFRGSTGYGTQFMEAGNGEWGGKMQDDITDGVKKMIADGIADPKRICIVGASYGGYAALEGAASTPDLYSCAVSVAGVSDIPMLIQSDTDILSSGDVGLMSYIKETIGNRWNDSANLAAHSPARNAKNIKIPVLLIHGKNDTTVPYKQSELMRDALARAGNPAELVTLEGDDHSFALAKSRIQMLRASEAFIAKHIGPSTGTPMASAAN